MTLRDAELVETTDTTFTLGDTTYIVEIEIKHDNKYYLTCTLYRDVFLGRTQIDTLMRHTATEDGVSALSQKLTNWAVTKAQDRERARSLDVNISVDVATTDELTPEPQCK